MAISVNIMSLNLVLTKTTFARRPESAPNLSTKMTPRLLQPSSRIAAHK